MTLVMKIRANSIYLNPMSVSERLCFNPIQTNVLGPLIPTRGGGKMPPAILRTTMPHDLKLSKIEDLYKNIPYLQKITDRAFIFADVIIFKYDVIIWEYIGK